MGRQREGGLVEYLPANAVAAGGRGARGATLYDAAVVDAHAALESFQPGAPVMGAGLLISFAEEGVLRVAVGPARRQLESQVAALRTLLDCSAPAVRNRVPKLLGRGRAGLADWSLESRLVGSRPASGLSDRVVEDCLDFLAALNSVGEAGEASASLREQAGVVASGLGDEEGRAVRDLAERLEDELTDVPRGFAHGDFHRGNMLESQGRLAGVVDWDAAGSGRLAFLDLLHLRLFSVPRRGGSHWGPALLDELVPWARAGGDAVLRGYCRRIGFEPSLRQLEALTIAYWLDRAAYELSMYADRSERREWQHRNVHLVLQAATARFPS